MQDSQLGVPAAEAQQTYPAAPQLIQKLEIDYNWAEFKNIVLEKLAAVHDAVYAQAEEAEGSQEDAEDA